MDETVVSRERLRLRDDRELLSPPRIVDPLYQCGTAVTVVAFLAQATLEVEVGGATVATVVAGFPEPVGETVPLQAPLVAGQQVRARQSSGGLTSDWSVAVVVRDHRQDYPAGPPRPVISPAPVYTCGSRTGVTNLLSGGNVWITADAAEVGRVDGCAAPVQGVNVNPFYSSGQSVRAWFEICGDPSPPSQEYVAQPAPLPLATPGFEPVHEGGLQLVVTGVVNGARVSLSRNGIDQGTWRCWGGRLMVGLNPLFAAGEVFAARQELCPGDPPSGEGTSTVLPCGSLPAPTVGPVQAGDTSITVTSCAPGASIRVYRNQVQVGLGSAPVVQLTQTLRAADTVHVVQSLPGCESQFALQLTVACVDPPFGTDPSARDLFPVGRSGYSDGPVRGSVYYPAEDDGPDQPFHRRLAEVGRVPIVFLVHGNHDPADPSYLGYDYFQESLARKGMVAVSVDCNALNGPFGGVANIEDRADLVLDSVRFFQQRDADPASTFFGRLDFDRVGLMGHSRGGDAVVMIPSVSALADVRFRAVLALAPTNFRYWSRLPTIAPDGYAFLTILPAADGDVRSNNGAQFYDQAVRVPFKSQLYVHSANHNFFNRQWLNDDAAPVAPVMPRWEHERVLDVYGSAFFLTTLLGDASVAFLDGTLRPSGARTQAVKLAFERARALTVDEHDEPGSTIQTNTLGLPTAQLGGMVADEYPFDRPPAPAFDGSFFGLTRGMVMTPRELGAVFRSEITRRRLRNVEIWLRVSEVPEGPLPGNPVGFSLGVEDGSGRRAWVSSDMVGGVPRPFVRPDVTKTMLCTLRFRTECLVPEHGRVDLDDVVALLLRYDRRGSAAVAFDDLQLVPV